jgi:hypothetical protein
MGAKERLVGSDASLYKMTFGPNQNSGTMTSGQWYKIATISGTTVFPAGYTVGDLFLGNGGTMSAGNSAALATSTVVADCSGFEMAFSRDEIEVTVLTDDVKKYRAGKSDLSGTVNGINFISEMKKPGSVANRFFKTVSATAGNVSTLSQVDGSALYGQFFIQDDTTTSGETHAFLFGQIELFGYNLGAAISDAQSWSSGLRFSGNDPIMYFKDNA